MIRRQGCTNTLFRWKVGLVRIYTRDQVAPVFPELTIAYPWGTEAGSPAPARSNLMIKGNPPWQQVQRLT